MTDLLEQRPNAVNKSGSPQLLRGLMLPLPPSINHYWKHRIIKPKGFASKPFMSTYISAEGETFRKRIAELALEKGFRFQTDKRLRLDVVVCARDRRRQDISNRIKVLEDCLKYAGVFQDDEQIDDLTVKRGPVIPEGRCVIHLTTIEPDYDQVFKDAWR